MPADPMDLDQRLEQEIRAKTRRPGGRIVVHPEARDWLAESQIRTGDDVYNLPGEVVGGHPDRHVVRVELPSRDGIRVVFLKREHVRGHRSRWRNFLAGFGRVSRCEREAKILQYLEREGIPAPRCLAHGEDIRGRAFLLVEELRDYDNLCTTLANPETDRQLLAERIGRYLAELNEAGFGTPDLAAKHVFVHRDSGQIALVDWQSTPVPGPVNWPDRLRFLAQVHATLPNELTNEMDRLRVLWAYCRVAKLKSNRRFSSCVNDISGHVKHNKHRSQRGGNTSDNRLIWLLGDEEVVTVLDLAKDWPDVENLEPFYTDSPDSEVPVWLTFPGGLRGVLFRYRTTDVIGRVIAAVRERPWRSPAVKAARAIFHLHNHGIDAPRLLAFGQRLEPLGRSQSFLVVEQEPDLVLLHERLQDPFLDDADRRLILRECGHLLRQLHEARCTLAVGSSQSAFAVSIVAPMKITVCNPLTLKLNKRIDERKMAIDLRDFTVGLPVSERAWVVRGYLGRKWANRRDRRRWLSYVL